MCSLRRSVLKLLSVDMVRDGEDKLKGKGRRVLSEGCILTLQSARTIASRKQIYVRGFSLLLGSCFPSIS
jgi:hypothetical protein